ncbi:MAG: fibronectin type III domain-containing protein, partial [Kofleriaceae bacterium]
AADEPAACRILDLELQPAANGSAYEPQIVAWLEDASGAFVETVYITRTTGTFGLGNRPGRFDFNSGPAWPYGRRTTVFPVWASRQPIRWPQVVFQDGADDGLSHSFAQSSPEQHYCRPRLEAEFDAVSCASPAFTDKGIFSTTETSAYPPREDLNPLVQDSPSVEMYATLNPFDAISQATPASGSTLQYSWAMPNTVLPGEYILWVEVSKELDMNGSYNASVFPSPDVNYGNYGVPYRGQPSVVYRVPFTIGATDTTGATTNYVGYGDPVGVDGTMRPPDATIDESPGTGAGRLAVISSADGGHRIHLVARRELDVTAPVAPRTPTVAEATPFGATVAFVAPGDDGITGMVSGYEIRFRVGEPVTAENFATASLVAATVTPAAAGSEQTVALEGLLPETTYSVGIRAFDNCRNYSELTIVEVVTPERPIGEVDACFIATAAYGSVMANDVSTLRRFRDTIMAKSVLGELAIETYYTFGPAVAGMIGESDLVRETARGALSPIVDRVKNLRP